MVTVYELIQELAKYDANAAVIFHANFDYSYDVEAKFDRDNENDVQEVTGDATFDDELDLVEVKPNFHNEVVLKLNY